MSRVRFRHRSFCSIVVALGLAGCSSSKKDDSSATETPESGTVNSAGTIAGTTDSTTTVQTQTSANAAPPSTAAYKSTNTPGTLAVELPESLTATSGAALVDAPDALQKVLDENDKLTGFQFVHKKMSQFAIVFALLTEQMFEFDQVLASVEADCASRLGGSWSSCTTESEVKTKLTADIAAAVIDRIGAAVMGETTVAALKARVVASPDVVLGTMTITKLKDDADGFTKCVELGAGGAATTFCFNADDVRVVQKKTLSDSSAYTIKTTYTAASKTMTIAEHADNLIYRFTNTFKLKSNPDARGPHGIVFSGSTDAAASQQVIRPDTGSYALPFIFHREPIGLADDLGGAIGTTRHWSNPHGAGAVQTFTLSDHTENQTPYVVAPTSATADTLLADYVAYLTGDGQFAGGNLFFIGSLPPAETEYKLWKVTTDGDGKSVATDANITMTELNVTIPDDLPAQSKEEFDAKGLVTYYATRSIPSDPFEIEDGAAGVYTGDYDAAEGDLGKL